MEETFNNIKLISRRDLFRSAGAATFLNTFPLFAPPANAEGENKKTYNAIIFFNLATNDTTINNLMYAVDKAISIEQVKDIYLIINSGGGDLEISIECYHFLRSVPKKLITVNGAAVQSAAVMIYLAGSNRLTYPESYFMLHSAATSVNYNEARRDVLENFARSVDQSDDLVKEILRDRTKLSHSEIEDLSEKRMYFSASDAVRKSISLGIGGLDLSKDFLTFYITADDKRYFSDF